MLNAIGKVLIFLLFGFWSVWTGAQGLVSDATYGQTADGVGYVSIPITDCVNVTATPIVVGDWLVYPMHEHADNCSGPGPYRRSLFGYQLKDGKLYLLRDDGAGEAPLLHWTEQDTLFWNTTFGGTVFMLDPSSFDLRRKVSVQTTSDAAGVVLDGRYYFGTINSPDHTCQNPTNPNCGAIFALDADGNVVRTLNMDNGFRAWIGTGLTTDGEYLYVGSAAQTVGEKSGDETESTYGCSVVKLDKDLNIVAAFDPGDLACYKLPFDGANMDSVSGEVVPDSTGLWVQYVRPNASDMTVALYRLDKNLEEVCHLEFDFEPQTQAVGFYGAPTVDKEGNAYVPISIPDQTSTRRARLLKVNPQCEHQTLADLPGVWAQASPTLADDRYVLFATDGRLGIYTLDGEAVREYTLGSTARVLASPVIHEGKIYVLQEDAALNVISDAGVTGYGSAIWPRYRHDNQGSAALALNQGEASSPTTQVRGVFIPFHLEVKDKPGIKALWPNLEKFMALADRYGHKITLQFSPQWADYVYQNGLLETIQAWEANGHEIALHHHGPTHDFFDGYTNDSASVREEGYFSGQVYVGDMAALMSFMAPLSSNIRSAGMSDEDTDWPEGVWFYATDSGDTPSKDDLLSTPVVKWHNGYPVVEIYNTGYLISHLGDAAVTLADIESSLQTATTGQYMGIVFNDETIGEDFEEIEPLFQLLQRYGVQARTVSDLLGKLNADNVSEAEAILDAGESQYARYFPAHETTSWFDPYLYRFYPDTGIYLGINVEDRSVYLLGGVFGSSLYRAGGVDEIKSLLGLSP